MTVNIANLWRYDLRRGPTDHPRHGACLFDAGMWLVYGKVGDDPPCSCPVIRSYATTLNDGMGHTHRQLLKPFILRVVGNRDLSAEAARLHYIVLHTARRVLPLVLSAFPEHKARLQSLSDDATYLEIRHAARAAHDTIRIAASASYAAHAARAVAARATLYGAHAAREALDATAADALAAHAARAAAARSAAAAREALDALAHATAADALAAYATTDAARSARSAAAARAASYATASDLIWSVAIGILDGALRIGRQSPEFDEAEIRTSVAAFERARAKKRAPRPKTERAEFRGDVDLAQIGGK